MWGPVSLAHGQILSTQLLGFKHAPSGLWGTERWPAFLGPLFPEKSLFSLEHLIQPHVIPLANVCVSLFRIQIWHNQKEWFCGQTGRHMNHCVETMAVIRSVYVIAASMRQMVPVICLLVHLYKTLKFTYKCLL